MSWLALGSLGLSLFQGFRSSQRAQAGASAGYNQSLYNAQQAGYFGQLNSQAHMEAAHINAGMVQEIANLNADYIESSGRRNLKMYGIQSEEEKRRHIRAEQMHAGAVRAAQSGTGIQVNTGSNLAYLHDQIDEGLRQRHFMLVRHAETKKSIEMDFTERAYVTRESGRLQAEAIMANGAISADMALANATYQQNQYTNQANAYQTAGDQAQSDFMWGALGSIGKFAIGGGFDDISTIFNPAASTASTPSSLAAPTLAPPALISASTGPSNFTSRTGIGNYASNFMGQL